MGWFECTRHENVRRKMVRVGRLDRSERDAIWMPREGDIVRLAHPSLGRVFRVLRFDDELHLVGTRG